MLDKNIWILIAAAILCVMLFGNRKVWLWAVLKEQLAVFKNAKKKRFSPWDCICFFIFPVILSWVLVYQLDVVISKTLAELLTTVFSIVFTVLFGFAAILVSKIDSPNKIEKQVTQETFVSIVSATLLSLIAAVLSIILTQLTAEIALQIISIGIFSFALIIIMLLLLITKRTFFLYIDHKN